MILMAKEDAKGRPVSCNSLGDVFTVVIEKC